MRANAVLTPILLPFISDIDVVVFGATGDLEVRLSKLATELEAAEVSLGRPLVIASAKVRPLQ
jgi:hypothetical protein